MNNKEKESDINMNENLEFNKEWIITLLLWFFLWWFGIHRFYNWKVGTWILMILTFWGFWIWWLFDGIIIVMWNFEKLDWTKIPVKI